MSDGVYGNGHCDDCDCSMYNCHCKNRDIVSERIGYEACRADVVAWMRATGSDQYHWTIVQIERGDADGFVDRGGT